MPTAASPAPATTPLAVPMPNLPTVPVTPPEVASASPPPLWPWPQAEPWDDRLLAGKVKNAMEAAKMNRKEEAVLILDEIGPHLGDRTRLMLYIGALLKSLGRSDALSSMLEIARKEYTEDEHVLAALKQMSSITVLSCDIRAPHSNESSSRRGACPCPSKGGGYDENSRDVQRRS